MATVQPQPRPIPKGMEIPSASVVSSVVPRRWLRCLVLHSVLASSLWIVFASLPFFRFPHGSGGGLFCFLLFLSSQLLFVLAQALVVVPEVRDSASAKDILFGALKVAWRAVSGASLLKGDSVGETLVLAQKLRATADALAFGLLCAASGLVCILSINGFRFRSGITQGAVLGLIYAAVFYHKKRMMLRFPIIQRRLFYSLKMGFPEAARMAARLSVVATPFAELANLLLNWDWFSYRPSMALVVGDAVTCVLSSMFICFCWELCHHLVQVMHTRRHRFAPPIGSLAAETVPSESLLFALEETSKSSIVNYLAFQDLCIVSESNVDSWRRAALFEETGETYQRIITACLRPIDMLTVRLSGGVGGLITSQNQDFFQQQMEPSEKHLWINKAGIDQMFRDFQLCFWCSRIVGALTARSKREDRYGVAQLRGCHSVVVSSLISCLLVVEASLGRNGANSSFNNSFNDSSSMGQNSIKWTVPSRGGVEELGKRRHKAFFKRQTLLHRRAYAMADVLSSSLYQIVSAFRSDMISGGNLSIEREWLSKGTPPLYGMIELHREKLNAFIDSKAG